LSYTGFRVSNHRLETSDEVCVSAEKAVKQVIKTKNLKIHIIFLKNPIEQNTDIWSRRQSAESECDRLEEECCLHVRCPHLSCSGHN